MTTADGRRLGAVVVNADLTAFRDAEGRLRRSEERHRRVVESMVDCVFETDELGRWTHLSDTWTTATGHPVEEIPRALVDGVRAPRRPRRVREGLRAAAGRRARRRARRAPLRDHRRRRALGRGPGARDQRLGRSPDGLRRASCATSPTSSGRASTPAPRAPLMRLLSVADSLEDVGESLIATLGHELGWDGAELWRMSDDELLRRTATWTAPGVRFDRFMAAGAGLGYEVGDGFPGPGVDVTRPAVEGRRRRRHEPRRLADRPGRRHPLDRRAPAARRRRARRGRRPRLAHPARARARASSACSRSFAGHITQFVRRRDAEGRAAEQAEDLKKLSARRPRARRAVRPLRRPDDADARRARRHRRLLRRPLGADRRAATSSRSRPPPARRCRA